MKMKVVPVVLAALLAAVSQGQMAGAAAQASAGPPSETASGSFAARPGGVMTKLPAQRLQGNGLTASRSQADCASLAKNARAIGVTQTSTCVSVEQGSAVDVILPECSQTSTPNVGWWAANRREACSHQQFDLTVIEIPSGRVVGTANLHAILEMTASGAGWSSVIGMWVWGFTGLGFPEFVTGNLFGCSGCVGSSSLSKTGPDTWRGTGNFAPNLAPGQILPNQGGFWELTIGSSKWSNSALVSLGLAAYRCDNAIGNRSPGCVFSNIPGVAGFSQSLNPDFVWHVYNAQVSGLPGQLNSGTYLTKLDNASLVNQNGARACPSSLVRPSGFQCDEYPFRSTYQGAATGGGTLARSFPWCQMPDPQRTGGSGWSRCFIPSGQNLSAGGLLGAFYSNERILDGDQFQVGYLP
jgi:hypothetical protein